MLGCIVFLCFITFSAWTGAVFSKLSFEKTLPITCFGVIYIQFLIGMLTNDLNTAFWVLLIGFMLMIIGSIYSIIRQYKTNTNVIKDVLCKVFNKYFFIFLLTFFAIIIFTYDMKVHEWDEFSHWGTVVKAMFYTDRWGCSIEADCPFGYYMPGMALFQLFIERLNAIFYCDLPRRYFSEWLLYFAYDILIVSFLLALISSIKGRKNKQI